MIQQIYSVRDSKTGFFGPLMLAHNHGEITRGVADEVQNPSSRLNRHPEDYDLYHHGEYDNTTGVARTLQTPQHVVKCIQLVQGAELPDFSAPAPKQLASVKTRKPGKN